MFELDMFSSSVIVIAFSFFVIGMDEWVVKAWRHKHWEKMAASGDQQKIELLRLAKSAVVVDE